MAVEWLERALFGGGMEVEIRQILEIEECYENATPELREHESRLRKQIVSRR